MILTQSTGIPSLSRSGRINREIHRPELSSDASSPAPGATMRRLKVLHVGKFYPPHMGGIETHLQALCGELRKSLDLRVIVASDDNNAGEETLQGVAVSRIPTRLTLASTPLCPGMIARIRRTDADIVHLHLPNPMAVLAFLASGHRGRLVMSYHSDTVRQKFLGAIFEPFLHAAMRRSSAVIAASPNYVNTSPVLSRYRERCHVIPYGIDIKDFERCDSKAVAAVRRQYGDRLIVSVGRLVYYKGFEYLIRAMAQVRGTLLIIGDGPLRKQLGALASEVGVVDRVHFIGKVDHDQLRSCYHAADAFVLASVVRSEAFGIVQIEAMAAGLPVVNTKLDSGVPFVSLHQQTGLTVPPADANALAAAINRLLDDRDLLRSFGAAARLRAQQEFSLERMLSRMIALYGAIMQDSGESAGQVKAR
jgi:glycosyltransferase involved in cell wall biosynthesis